MQWFNFYPRPPRGGRPINYCTPFRRPRDFYPRPPRGGRQDCLDFGLGVQHFYPRPPRGGRRLHKVLPALALVISIHALREEGDSRRCGSTSTSGSISIHALREEGDATSSTATTARSNFYPRPPRGGRPWSMTSSTSTSNFYPRPPRGGRPVIEPFFEDGFVISIHALREEGDASRASSFRRSGQFLSTPSARRATTGLLRRPRGHPISIHALREEGDEPLRTD